LRKCHIFSGPGIIFIATIGYAMLALKEAKSLSMAAACIGRYLCLFREILILPKMSHFFLALRMHGLYSQIWGSSGQDGKMFRV
jgi:hypothetical protein